MPNKELSNRPGKPSSTKAKAKKKQVPPGKRAVKKKNGQTALTFIKIGRSVHKGGATLVRYTKKGIGQINEFTQNDDPSFVMPKFLRGLRLNFGVYIAVGLVILLIGIMLMSGNNINVERITVSVPGLPSDLEDYKILHISDLHGQEFGENQATLLRTINSLSYNVLLMTGDMVGQKGNPEPLYALLDGLSLNRRAFFIPGDSDPPVLLDVAREIENATLNELVLSDWVLGAQEHGATYLSYPMSVQVGNSLVWFSPDTQLSLDIPATANLLEDQLTQERSGIAYGIITDYETLPFTNWRYNQALNLKQAASDMVNKNDLHISLSHFPPSREYVDVSQALSQAGEKSYLRAVDLILAGHYCGGGWRLPGYGALYIPNTLLDRHGWLPDQTDVRGIKTLGSTMLYTSAGLGMTDAIKLPKIRLFNTPEITLITLTAQIQTDLQG